MEGGDEATDHQDRRREAGQPGADHLDLLAHITLASFSEVAMHIARAENQVEALSAGQPAADLLLDRVVGPAPDQEAHTASAVNSESGLGEEGAAMFHGMLNRRTSRPPPPHSCAPRCYRDQA